jgi:hypothetical protein
VSDPSSIAPLRLLQLIVDAMMASKSYRNSGMAFQLVSLGSVSYGALCSRCLVVPGKCVGLTTLHPVLGARVDQGLPLQTAKCLD